MSAMSLTIDFEKCCACGNCYVIYPTGRNMSKEMDKKEPGAGVAESIYDYLRRKGELILSTSLLSQNKELAHVVENCPLDCIRLEPL